MRRPATGQAGRRIALAALAGLLAACGVKAPPRPPERTGLGGSKHDLRSRPPDGGVPEGEIGGAPGGGASGGAPGGGIEGQGGEASGGAAACADAGGTGCGGGRP